MAAPSVPLFEIDDLHVSADDAPPILKGVDLQIGPGLLYGRNPVPMMGVGNPHAPEARN